MPLAGACSDDDPARPADLVLTRDDLPAGWDGAPHDASNDDFERTAERFEECIGREPRPMPDDVPTAHSPDFSRDSGAQQAKSTVQRLGARAAERAVDGFRDDRSADCLTQVLELALDEADLGELEVRGVESEPLALAELPVEHAAGIRTRLDLRVGGADVDVHIDNVLLGDGPWFARLYLLGLTDQLRDDLVEAVAERVDDAGA